MAKKRKKLKVVPPANVQLLRPENDPDTILEDCKGLFDAVLIVGYDKDECLESHNTENLSFSDINTLIDAYKAELWAPEDEDE